ncbi:hypothetical protein ACET3Z_027744 [Daucus carota]
MVKISWSTMAKASSKGFELIHITPVLGKGARLGLELTLTLSKSKLKSKSLVYVISDSADKFVLGRQAYSSLHAYRSGTIIISHLLACHSRRQLINFQEHDHRIYTNWTT